MAQKNILVTVAVVAAAAANPGTCVATKCAGALARCLADSVCRPWMFCTPRCPKNDLACQIRCGDLYKPTDGSASKIDEFSECSISEHHCVPQQKLTCSIPRNAKGRLELNTLTGTWYVTRGWNPMFDCFDCQVHHFSLQQGAKPLLGDLKYAVKKDLTCTAPNCDYLPREVHQSFAQDPENPMHLINHNNSAKEMHYMDDWYVLASRPNVYALIYYCGCNDACCGYAGAVLYTRSPRFEDLSTQDVDLKSLLIARGRGWVEAMFRPGGKGGVNYGDIPPNQTLYVNNLNEKIKISELKNCLLELFSSYGEVIDIVAAGSMAKKGQAFVVFRDISCATNALRALNGFTFLDKPMKINYCRTKSDVVAHEDGTWKPRAKLEAQKEEAKRPKTTPALVPPKNAAPKAAAHPAGGDPDGNASNVLFVENLPAEVNELMLTMLFRQYPGFQEARLIKGRNVAFIEYADELQAGIAKHGLQGFMVTPEMALKIAFAKQ